MALDPTTIVKVATPWRRVLRETLQWVIAFAVAAPVVWGMLAGDDVSGTDIAERVAAVAGAVKFVATLIMNRLDGLGGTDTPLLGVKVTPPTHPEGA